MFMKKQLEILEKELQILKKNEKIEAVLLIGSVAYGTATDDSDLDLIVISNEDRFESKYVENILVEIHFHKYSTLVKRLNNNPNEVYKYLYSKIVFDNGQLKKLIAKAKEIKTAKADLEKTEAELTEKFEKKTELSEAFEKKKKEKRATKSKRTF